ncbi:hypothetical protein E9840_11195 [Tissierella creatinini]|nr:hypothetical protein E9840_11195 [Tissierella creatinini]TJX62898.1 hypothetical protein E8P77_16240 [Soehngenia saccharolytica]
MDRDSLVEKFYYEYGYIPDSDELEHFEREQNLNQEEYSVRRTVTTPQREQSGYSTYRQLEPSEPEDVLIKELKGLFKDITTKAKSSLREKQNDILDDEKINEFNYMLTTFLLKAALYFVIKGGFQKGYNYSDLY